jgi:hypothetical protein
MATRERRLAEFNGNGEPPPDQPVQVLCEDHSGTYQLPFARCHAMVLLGSNVLAPAGVAQALGQSQPCEPFSRQISAPECGCNMFASLPR